MLSRFVVAICFTSFLFFSGSAQEFKEGETIFTTSLTTLYTDTGQAVKAVVYIRDNATGNSEKAEAYYLLSECGYFKDDYVKSIENLFNANKQLQNSEDNFLKSLVATQIAARCRMLGIYDQSKIYLSKSWDQLKNITEPHKKNAAQCLLLYEEASLAFNAKDYTTAKLKYTEALNVLHPSEAIYPAFLARTEVALANVYFFNSEEQKSRLQYTRAVNFMKENGMANSAIAAAAYNGLGRLLIASKEYAAAADMFKNGLSCKVTEWDVKQDLLKNLSDASLTVGNHENYKKYYQLYKDYAERIIAVQRESRNTIISLIENDQESTLEKQTKNYTTLLIILFAIILLSVLAYVLYNKKLNREYKRFEKLLEKIENEKEIKTPEQSSFSIREKTTRGLVIPEKTEQAILQKLKEFETGTAFTNADMSLQELSRILKTNSKYLSEIINTHKSRNFNTYINELRINHIIRLLQTDKRYLTYKVSYLAEQCGFSSHSAFTIVFKSITDLTPKQFIMFLKKK